MIVEPEPVRPQEPAQAARDPRMGVWGLLAGMLVIVAYLVWGDSYTVHGTVNFLKGSSPQFSGSIGPCQAYGDFSDIRPGADVTIRDDTGKIVATGQLGDGQYVNTYGYRTYCQWPFTVNGVPQGSSFYRVQLTDRAPVTYAPDQLGNVSIEVSDPDSRMAMRHEP